MDHIMLLFLAGTHSLGMTLDELGKNLQGVIALLLKDEKIIKSS